MQTIGNHIDFSGNNASEVLACSNMNDIFVQPTCSVTEGIFNGVTELFLGKNDIFHPTYLITSDVFHYFLIDGDNQKDIVSSKIPLFLNDQNCWMDGDVLSNEECTKIITYSNTKSIHQFKEKISKFMDAAVTATLASVYYSTLVYVSPTTTIPYIALAVAKNYDIQGYFIGKDCYESWGGNSCKLFEIGFPVIKGAAFAATSFDFNNKVNNYIYANYQEGIIKTGVDLTVKVANGLMLKQKTISTASDVVIETLKFNNPSSISKKLPGFGKLGPSTVEKSLAMILKSYFGSSLLDKFLVKAISKTAHSFSEDLVDIYSNNTNIFSKTFSSKATKKSIKSIVCRSIILGDYKKSEFQSHQLGYCLANVGILLDQLFYKLGIDSK